MAQYPTRRLIITPPKVDLQADPGEIIHQPIKIVNESNETVSVIVKKTDFIVSGPDGIPEFVTEAVSGRWSLSNWITLSDTKFTLAPKKSFTVDAYIQVPENALPGGHYASVYFQPTTFTTKNMTMSEIATKLGSLINLRVSGPTVEKAFLKRFWAPKFSEYGPVKIITEIENQGDYHIKPIGYIQITDIIGRLRSTLVLKNRNIFPLASRIYENEFPGQWHFGRYKAQLTVGYGETGQALSGVIYFWIIPWKVCLIVILALAIIILIVYLQRKKKQPPVEEKPTKIIEESPL